ncbi:hypothetical protein KR200_007146 [Drosophila serrata]|nr:hypothetical protein KR200_007146 [Drosophila serrata]
MENHKIVSIFALGPAPPGYRKPNSSLFIHLESQLLTISRRMKYTAARIDRLRGAHRIETCTAMRETIKEQVMKAINDQIQARDIVAKYSLKLKALQEAEIMKVVKHMQRIDRICQEKCTKLAHLRGIITEEHDPAKVRCHQKEIYALVKAQEKFKDLRDRWKLRLTQMEAAKVKSLKPPSSSKSVNASKKVRLSIDSRNNDKIRCKRCDFLQRTNKNKKNCPKVCTVCLKWAHKVLQDGVEILPNRNIPSNNTTTPNSATEIFAKTESIDIEEIPLIQEDKASINKSIYCKTILYLLLYDLQTEIVAKTDSIDFDEIRLIQDGLKAIDNKNTALAHVRILQEYAMLNYNFRAIGLLSEVEASIIIPEKTPDFEG